MCMFEVALVFDLFMIATFRMQIFKKKNFKKFDTQFIHELQKNFQLYAELKCLHVLINSNLSLQSSMCTNLYH